MPNEPKVLVGCPTSNHKEYCINEFLEGVRNLTYKNLKLLLVDNSETPEYAEKLKSMGVEVIKDAYTEIAMERIVHSRNILVDYALKNNYDYFFSLEQDVIPPKDVIERLLAYEVDVVSGLYGQLFGLTKGDDSVIIPLIWDWFTEGEIEWAKKNINKLRDINPEAAGILESTDNIKELMRTLRKPMSFEQLKGKGLIKIKCAGLGCMLIKASVFQKVRFRRNPEGFDDMTFSFDIFDAGIPMYADTSVLCDHLVKPGQWLNIGKLF